MDSDELVTGRSDVEVGLFLVHEERVGHPDVLDEVRPDGQGFDSRPLSEGEPRISPELTEVEVQCEVL